MSGRGSNMEAILEACRFGRIPGQVVLVMSNRPNAPALERAEKWGVPTRVISSKEPDYEEKMAQALEEAQVDLICLAGFMKVLSPSFVKRFPQKILNIHPALLPSFPGLHAQEQAIQKGVKISGATVHFVDEQVDHGPIILQAAVPVLDGDTAETLAERILREEHRIYPEAIRLIAEGRVRLRENRVEILEE
ncbi:MAG: phosphoribosylglycinamide formyltransferase [bacterium JZ-2024 1]